MRTPARRVFLALAKVAVAAAAVGAIGVGFIEIGERCRSRLISDKSGNRRTQLGKR